MNDRGQLFADFCLQENDFHSRKPTLTKRIKLRQTSSQKSYFR